MLSADALTDASATAATQAPSSEQALPALKSKGKLRSWFSKIGRKVGRKSSDSTGTPATALAAPASTNLLGSLAKLGRKLTADKPSALSLPHELEEETAKVFAAIEEEFSERFEKEGYEGPKRVLTFEDQKQLYQWQLPGTTNPSYPPCLAAPIPPENALSLLRIFNFERFVGVTVSIVYPLVPLRISNFLFGEPIGRTMDSIVERQAVLRKEKKNIGTVPSVGDRLDWFSDSVFGQQSFTGPNPVTIKLASAPWIEKFTQVALLQKNVKAHTILSFEPADSFYIQDYSYFRDAMGAAGDAVLVSKDNKRWGCGSVTLFQLSTEGDLHPLAIVLDYTVSIEKSVVIFNQRLKSSDPTESEKEDWPWRYAKMCNQVSDWVRHEMAIHLNDCHFIEEATIVAAYRSFPSNHVVYNLLEPHWLKTLSLNSSARSTLVPDFVLEIVGLSDEQAVNFILNAYKKFDWEGRYIPNDLKTRGFDPSKLNDKKYHNYAYAKNMNAMWPVLYTFVSSILKTVYKADSDVAKDKAVQSWSFEMRSSTGGQMTSFPQITTFKQLASAIVGCIHIASPQHNAVNYLQSYYMSFVPNKPSSLSTPLPTSLAALNKYTEQDIINALPVNDPQTWFKCSQLTYMLSYKVSEDKTLAAYALDLAKSSKEPEIVAAAEGLSKDLIALGIEFRKNSEAMDDKIVPYHVMDPSMLAVSVLI